MQNLAIGAAFLFAFLLLGVFIGGVILRAACAFFNKLTGPGGRVEEPGVGKAMGIVALTALVNVGIGIAMSLAMGHEARAFIRDPQTRIASNLVSLPISFCVMAVMITLMMPTSLPRGFAIAALYFVVTVFVVAVVLGIFLALAFALGFGGFAGRRW